MEQTPKSGLSTAALIMGIVCIVMAILPFGNFIFGLLGLIFAIICLVKKKGKKSKSVWALILSIAGWVLKVINLVIIFIVVFVVVGFGSVVAAIAPTLTSMGLDSFVDTLESFDSDYDFGNANDYNDWDSLTDDYNNLDWDALDNWDDDDYWNDEWNWDDYDGYEDDDYGYDWDYGDSWDVMYLPSDIYYDYGNFRFSIPEGFYDNGEMEYEGGSLYCVGTDTCDFFFPELVYEYESDDMESACDEVLDYWLDYSNCPDCITWVEDGIYFWNDDWYYTSFEYDDGENYAYFVLAFSTNEDTIVVISANPYDNECTDECYSTRCLIDYIEYLG